MYASPDSTNDANWPRLGSVADTATILMFDVSASGVVFL